MKRIKLSAISRVPLILLTLAMSNPASTAETYHFQCSKDAEVRTLSVHYDSDAETPCAVHYTKRGSEQLLWSAKTQIGYCEAKAASFIEQLVTKGWHCQRRSGAAPASSQ